MITEVESLYAELRALLDSPQTTTSDTRLAEIQHRLDELATAEAADIVNERDALSPITVAEMRDCREQYERLAMVHRKGGAEP